MVTTEPTRATAPNIYPNPVANVLHVPAAPGSTYQLFDLNGRLVRLSQLHQPVLHLGPASSPGFYVLCLYHPDGRPAGITRLSWR